MFGGIAATAKATKSRENRLILVQLKRYNHADGFIKCIGRVAYRTIYSSNRKTRLAWKHTLHHLMLVRADATNKLNALRKPVVVFDHSHYAGVQSIGYANPYCESGGDPYNAHNSTYRGKWQFDQSTWDSYAPSQWKGHDPAYVPESVQDWTAQQVPYDAWPNC